MPTWIGRLARPAILTGAGLVIGAGLFLVVIGFHDGLMASRVEERLLGLSLAVSGAAMICGPFVGRYGKGVMLGAFVVGSIGALLLIAVQAGYETSTRMVWWILLCLLPLAAAVTVLARPGQPSRWSAQTRIAVFTVAAGLLVPLGGLVSGAFKPVSDAEVPNVSAETSIVGHRKAADGSPLAVVEADVTLENIGKRRLVVIGSVYTVFGAQSRGRVLKPPVPWAYAAEMASTSWSGRSEEPYVTHAVEMGYDVVTPGNTLDPGQRIVVRILTPVPAAEDNTAGIDVSVATAFADRLRLGDQLEDPNDGTMSATHAVTAVWNVEPTSWVARLTRGRSVVAMDYQVSPMSDWPVSGSTAVPDDPHSVYGTYRVGLDEQTLQRADRYNAKPETFYGTAWTGAESTVAVDGGGK